MRALIRITEWEKGSGWRRIFGAFVRVGILIAIVAVLLETLGPPIGVFITTRMIARRMPAVKVSPQPLSDYSTDDSPGTTISYFGYEFEVPWKTAFKEKAFKKDWLAQLQFDSGQNITFIVPKQARFFNEVSEDKSLNMDLRPILGDLMDRSAYEQYGTLLSTTPRSIRAFGLKGEAIRGITLLTIKAIAMSPGLESGAFVFELPDKRGFQIGDPERSRRVDLQVFELAGTHVEILCRSTNETVHFSQPELNRVLATLHRTASTQVANFHQ